MKVVFLDFDGTLTPMGKASLNDEAIKESVKNFNLFLEKVPDLKIVISSSWRRHGMGYCKRFLDGLGIDPDKVVGLTGFEVGDRGLQIQHYLNRHSDITHFVILDDQSDMAPLLTKWVKTSQYTGITKQTIKEAISILNS